MAPDRKRPLWPAALTLLGVMIFSLLGAWQLQRARDKAELLADYGERRDAPAQPVSAVGELADLPRFTHVALSGRFDAAHTVLLENQLNAGRLGVSVFTPLLLDGGGSILVDRGFVPVDDQGSVPGVETPGGALRLTGFVGPPPAVGLRLGDVGPMDAWPARVPYLDLDRIAASAGLERLAGVTLRLDPEAPAGFLREWQPLAYGGEFGPKRHQAYAVQWFSLGLAAVIIYIVLTRRGARR